MVVSFNTIAIFILATTKQNGHHQQDYKNYFNSRIIPIMETWGKNFHNLFFVFGTNNYDYKFLQSRCKPKLASESDRTNSLYDLYTCPIYNNEINYGRKNVNNMADLNLTTVVNAFRTISLEFKVIWSANCTGKYFGIGPTCRCQESMRYFNRDNSLSNSEWFAFMDDDVYIRPYSLVSMLNELERVKSNDERYRDRGIALVSANKYISFGFSKRKLNQNEMHRCRNSSAYSFPYAQPAIINRKAMQRMLNGIDNNALTGLQSIWGGTHDSALGMLLWMYAIPTLSFRKSYFGTPINIVNDRPDVTVRLTNISSFNNNNDNSSNRNSIIDNRNSYQNNNFTAQLSINNSNGDDDADIVVYPKYHYIFHRVMNFKSYTWSKTLKIPIYKCTKASQYDIGILLGDDVLYSNELLNISTRNTRKYNNTYSYYIHQQQLQQQQQQQRQSIQLQQMIVGRESVQYLQNIQPSLINLTVFANRAKQIHIHYEHFRLQDCVLL